MSVRPKSSDNEARLYASFPCEVRSLDEESRTASFVASTENPVPTWDGPEVLRMSGARLERFRKNSVVLDSHNRYGLDAVIGKATVRVDKEKRQLHAEITYAPTERGEQAWTLVKGGFVRAVSIGYAIDRKSVLRLREGESDGEGDAKVNGPAVIVKRWELLEVSNVPVPADADAVRRSFYESIHKEAAPMESVFARAAGEGETTPSSNGGGSGAGGQIVQAKPTIIQNNETPEERAARVLEANKRQALAITPRGLEHITEAGLLAGKSLEQIRADLVKAHAERNKPVGTPEPAPIENTEKQRSAEKPLPDYVTDDVIVRSFENLG